MKRTCAAARQTFPALRHLVFLDAACVSLVSDPVFKAVQRFLELCRMPQAADASLHHIEMDRMRQRAVVEAARLINAETHEIALVESTTHGLNIAANALPLQRGDRVLIADTEFLQVAIPWKMKEKTHGIEVVPLRSGNGGVLPFDSIERAVDARTRVICISSVQWCSGYRVDLAALSELCRAKNIFLVVDAIQELGACPVDVRATPVDFLISGGHKWLNAPFGCGILYVSPRCLEHFEPASYGYLALEEPAGGWGEYFRTPGITPYHEWRFRQEAAKFEIAGTSNYPGAAGLAASLLQINSIGKEEIYRHILQLADRLQMGLDRLGARLVAGCRQENHRSGITVFTYFNSIDKEKALLQRLLEKKAYVAMRYTSQVGGIRVSTHFYNNEADIEALLDALKTSV